MSESEIDIDLPPKTNMFVSHLKDLISTNCQYSYSCGVQVEVFFGNGVIMCSLADRLNQVCHG